MKLNHFNNKKFAFTKYKHRIWKNKTINEYDEIELKQEMICRTDDINEMRSS